MAAEDFVGPLKTGTIGDLIGLIQSGGAYATIGTREYPIDAVRGQIR